MGTEFGGSTRVLQLSERLVQAAVDNGTKDNETIISIVPLLYAPTDFPSDNILIIILTPTTGSFDARKKISCHRTTLAEPPVSEYYTPTLGVHCGIP